MYGLIDVHAHILPHIFLKRVEAGQIEGVVLQKEADGRTLLSFGVGKHPCTKPFYDEQTQLAQMNEKGICMQAISISPRLFFYERDAAWNAEFCRVCNDEILARCAAYPDRFLPVGHIPMQDPELAAAEARRLHARGVRVIQIGTTIHEKCLDDTSFDPVYSTLEELGIVLMLHPLIVNRDVQTKRHHLSNAVGNPYQTSAAASNLIAGGVFDRFAKLQVMLVHGGGFLPFQIGRLDHAYAVRPSHEFNCIRTPSEYIRTNLLFEDLLYTSSAMQLQKEIAGEDRIFYGTDYPYDMADYGRNYDQDKLKKLHFSTLALFGKASS